MKPFFSPIQLLRLFIMVVDVAIIIYAFAVLPMSRQLWISVGLLAFGFVVMLVAYLKVVKQYNTNR